MDDAIIMGSIVAFGAWAEWRSWIAGSLLVGIPFTLGTLVRCGWFGMRHACLELSFPIMAFFAMLEISSPGAIWGGVFYLGGLMVAKFNASKLSDRERDAIGYSAPLILGLGMLSGILPALMIPGAVLLVCLAVVVGRSPRPGLIVGLMLPAYKLSAHLVEAVRAGSCLGIQGFGIPGMSFLDIPVLGLPLGYVLGPGIALALVALLR